MCSNVVVIEQFFRVVDSLLQQVQQPQHGQLPGICIADLLWFVEKESGVLSELTHVLKRYVKQEADPRLILACIVAMGTNMGLWKRPRYPGTAIRHC